MLASRISSLTSRRGITSLDVLFLIAILGGATGLCVWIQAGTYQAGNELAAMTTLRLIEQAQKDHQKKQNKLAGIKELAALKTENNRSLLPQEFVQGDQLKGYAFRVFFSEPPTPPAAETPEEKLPAEAASAPLHWCAYAMPVRYGWTGHRTFFINESGQIYFIDEPKITGKDPGKIQRGLAYKERQPFGKIDSWWTPLGEEAKY
jgi:hypothetical protein